MKKRIRQAAALALGLLISLPAVKAETELLVNQVSVPDSFRTVHPEVVIENKNHWYETTGEMTTEMLLGTFDSDMFRLDSIGIDYHSIMEKGYCLDLSGSEIIRNAIQNLYPVYADQCMKDGKIYAVPITVQLNYMTMNPDVLAETGMSTVEIPDTFPEFLDFVERWVDYLEENPEGIALYSRVNDIVYYNEQTYTLFLVNELLDNHILQKSFAGEPLRFNEPEVVELLKRCYQLGQRLYENDQGPNVAPSILRSGGGAFFGNVDNHFLPLRLNENQPKLIDVYLDLYAANALTDNPELCIEMLEDVVQDNDLTDEFLQTQRTFLYQNMELVPSTQYEETIANMQRLIHETRDALNNENLTAADRYELEERLEMQEERLKEDIASEGGKWVVTQEQFDIYRSYTDYLYVSMPGVFNANEVEQAEIFEQLKARFVAGQMTAEELVNELDRVAEMIERESE